jgi:hypothetical protein
MGRSVASIYMSEKEAGGGAGMPLPQSEADRNGKAPPE